MTPSATCSPIHDFDGNTTTTYNVRNQVLTDDRSGRTRITVNVYDAFGNLTQTTDPEGGVSRGIATMRRATA